MTSEERALLIDLENEPGRVRRDIAIAIEAAADAAQIALTSHLSQCADAVVGGDIRERLLAAERRIAELEPENDRRLLGAEARVLELEQFVARVAREDPGGLWGTEAARLMQNNRA